ncbi:hypothetical protein [Defluviimonas sp. WL0075]|uniref:Uncharacterized protein n=1 Tax=Albidovulum sediminicola TaxID=2984331 RepID=A0ABT2Z0S3_9RHOB|nr:hypothetical protein [Defluviimonas sp. WL0075]MCV2864702.1 hypothetical protein [Defluviimonas sp. WL0075]
MDLSKADPKGLVRESYAIEGITPGECRSIFLDWALSIAAGTDAREAMRVLIATYAFTNEGHPMNAVLEAGLTEAPKAARRGGRMGRLGARG